MYTIGL